MMIDVGCGVNPHPAACVGVDLYMGAVSPDIHVEIDPQRIPNPIKADIHHLPLRSKVFEEAYCRAVLEHVEDPTKALRELLRVSRCRVQVIIPHRYFRNRAWQRPPREHRWFFGVRQVRAWLNSLGLRYHLWVERKPYPSALIPIVWLPHLIYITIYLERWNP